MSPGDAVPPLALERCVAVHAAGGEPSLVEPLPALLACARRLAALQAPEGEGEAAPGGGSEPSAGMGSQPPGLREERGCESSQALQVGRCGRGRGAWAGGANRARARRWAPDSPPIRGSHAPRRRHTEAAPQTADRPTLPPQPRPPPPPPPSCRGRSACCRGCAPACCAAAPRTTA